MLHIATIDEYITNYHQQRCILRLGVSSSLTYFVSFSAGWASMFAQRSVTFVS
jgi:hypothetical protein